MPEKFEGFIRTNNLIRSTGSGSLEKKTII